MQQTQPSRTARVLLALAGLYLVGSAVFLLWQASLHVGDYGAALMRSLQQSASGAVMTGTLVGSGPVVHVRDGDTVEVVLQGATVPVRLIGVDTPESVKPNTPVQCYAREASAFTKQFEGDQVTLYEDPTQDGYDKYSRLLAYVILPDGRQLNALLVEQGFGREYTYQKPYLYQSEFRTLQQQAKATGRGLWSACPQQ